MLKKWKPLANTPLFTTKRAKKIIKKELKKDGLDIVITEDIIRVFFYVFQAASDNGTVKWARRAKLSISKSNIKFWYYILIYFKRLKLVSFFCLKYISNIK